MAQRRFRPLNYPQSVGDVVVTGTPANNELAIWTDANTIEGDSGLTFDGTTLTLTDTHLLRLEDDTDVSLTSTDHAFQIGLSTGPNIAMDANEIIARDNDAGALLTLNAAAGEAVRIGWGLQIAIITTAELEDIADIVNTGASKRNGTMYYNSDTDAPVWASGNTDASVWVDGTGATAHTPVV